MGLEQWGASEQYYEIASVHPEYELGRVISSVRQEEISTIPIAHRKCRYYPNDRIRNSSFERFVNNNRHSHEYFHTVRKRLVGSSGTSRK